MTSACLPPAESRRLISASLDAVLLSRLFGAFADGYTDADVNEVFGTLSAATGLDFAVIWNRHDDWGFEGDSDFALRVDGKLHSFTQVSGADILDFLYGEGPCPEEISLAIGEEQSVAIERAFNAA